MARQDRRDVRGAKAAKRHSCRADGANPEKTWEIKKVMCSFGLSFSLYSSSSISIVLHVCSLSLSCLAAPLSLLAAPGSA